MRWHAGASDALCLDLAAPIATRDLGMTTAVPAVGAERVQAETIQRP